MLPVISTLEKRLASAVDKLYPRAKMPHAVRVSLDRGNFDLYSPISVFLASLTFKPKEEIADQLASQILDPSWTVNIENGYLQFKLNLDQVAVYPLAAGLSRLTDAQTMLIPYQTRQCQGLSHLRLCAAATLHFALLRNLYSEVSLYFGEQRLASADGLELTTIFRELLKAWNKHPQRYALTTIRDLVVQRIATEGKTLYWGAGPYWSGLKGDYERQVQHIFPADGWLFEPDQEIDVAYFAEAAEQQVLALLLYLAGPTLCGDLDLSVVSANNFENLEWMIGASFERIRKNGDRFISADPPALGPGALCSYSASTRRSCNWILDLCNLDLLNLEAATTGEVPKLLGRWRESLIELNAEINSLLYESRPGALPFRGPEHLIYYGANHAVSAMIGVLQCAK